jgi:hypothetical protein
MKKIIALAFTFCCFYSLSAQPGDPGGDPDVPISGIEILLGMGGAYGAKKLIQKKKKSS